jgi:hypothetical protein
MVLHGLHGGVMHHYGASKEANRVATYCFLGSHAEDGPALLVAAQRIFLLDR